MESDDDDDGWQGITQAMYDVVSHNLSRIGAIPLHQYLHGDTMFDQTSAPSPPPAPVPSPSTARSTESTHQNAITRLNQTCQHTFGNTDALKYEFIEENGQKSKQCILTITRPDGSKRSYATQPVFSRKAEAKAEASKIAIDMDALNFLMFGEKLPPIPVNAPSNSILSVPRQQDSGLSSVGTIEKYCLEWRPASVTPHWVALTDPKVACKYGFALQIQLSPHVDRVYMSQPTCDTYDEAKEACAKTAIAEGILNFIRHGNGQVRPPSPKLSPSSPENGRDSHSANSNTPLALQTFFDSLPRPFPEKFDTNDVHKINAPGWLHSLIQSSRGSKLTMSYFFTSGSTPGLHGCLLRINQAENYKAYLVEARFAKRADAKAAVILQAMTRGVGDYIRSIAMSVELKVTPKMRSFSSNYIYPTLQSELNKINSALHPEIQYTKDRDAFGATLVVELSTSSTPSEMWKYEAPCEYRNKADARVAVIALAAEQGVVEFVRFRGRPPPAGYSSPFILRNYDPDVSRKRPHPDSHEEEQSQSSKKQKKAVPRELDENSFARGENNQSCDVSSEECPGGGCPQDVARHWKSNVEQSLPGLPSGLGSRDAHPQQLPSRGVHSPSPYGTLHPSFSPPYFDPRPYTDSSIAGPANFRGSERFTHPGMCSHPSFSQHPILSGSSSVPVPISIDTRKFSSASTRHSDSDLEPGEVLSPCSTRSFSQSTKSGNVENMKTVDPRKSKLGNPAKGTPSQPGGHAHNHATPKSPTRTPVPSEGRLDKASSGEASKLHVKSLIEYCTRNGLGSPSLREERNEFNMFKVWIIIGKERFELGKTYQTAEEGRQRVAKQVLARLRSQRKDGDQ
ncbi:hypothetical protein V8B97DRAFT_1994013 [Scleroderma yunnanense]